MRVPQRLRRGELGRFGIGRCNAAWLHASFGGKTPDEVYAIESTTEKTEKLAAETNPKGRAENVTKVAFVVLSHSNPAQLLRLTTTLMRLYEDPQIVCHHNFTLCPLNQNEFPSVCQFVRPHIDAKWGEFSLVRAGLLAIEMLHQLDGWEWFFLLSGSDYPIAAAERVRRELLLADFDVLIDSRLARVVQEAVDVPDEKGEFSHSRPYWCSLAYDRYLTYHISFPGLKSSDKRRLRVRSPMLLKIFGKWPIPFRVYAGDQWFGGNRRTAEVLLHHPERRAILKFFETTRGSPWLRVPDEATYQTLVCNSDLILSRLGSRRFSKWPHPDRHPKWLGQEDFLEIVNSNAWFARKFLPDDPALDLLDKYLGLK